MQVFISWSGERSRTLAAALRDWLPLVIQALRPWFSPEDIDKGARWLADLNSQLESQSAAIICLTPENLAAPWLLFEAGALSKSIDSSSVSPVLLDVDPTSLEGPLAQFQWTVANKDDIRRLLGSMNRLLPKPLDDRQLDTSFEHLWPQLEGKIQSLIKAGPPVKKKGRSESSILDEVLAKVRAIERQIASEGRSRQRTEMPPDVRRKRDLQRPSTALSARTDRANVSLTEALAGIRAIDTTLALLPESAVEERARHIEKRERLQQRVVYLREELSAGGSNATTGEKP